MIGELTILKGKAKNLYFENTSKDFFNDNLQAKAGVLAVGAAAIGSFSTAAVMTKCKYLLAPLKGYSSQVVLRRLCLKRETR